MARTTSEIPATKEAVAPTGTQSVERAFALLTAFTEEHPERRISELGAHTGLGQSTVSRLVATLETLGFLAQDDRSGLYHLGRSVIGLAGVALNQSPVFRQARQIAQNLAHELGLGANVAELAGGQLFYLCHFEGPRAPRGFTMVGRGGPLHATALGKALICDWTREDIVACIGQTFPTFTRNTISRVDNLLPVLVETRARGYATELEELALGRACLAAPIRDRSGRTVAALSVSGPLSAINLAERQDRLALTVIEHADQVSTALGYHTAAALY